SPFAAWESFYVIIGSSGAALTGLQFVVIALSAEGRATRTAQSVGAFGTPTVVHFCAVLLIAGILSMPWHAVSSAALALGISGADDPVVRDRAPADHHPPPRRSQRGRLHRDRRGRRFRDRPLGRGLAALGSGLWTAHPER